MKQIEENNETNRGKQWNKKRKTIKQKEENNETNRGKQWNK